MPFSFSTESTSIHAGTTSASDPISAVPRLRVLTRGRFGLGCVLDTPTRWCSRRALRCHTFTESGTQLPETRWSGEFGGEEVPKVYEVSVMQKEYVLEI